jgi:putative ABC transport system substrate-binding protein
MWGNENDPGTKSHVSAFTQALADALETAARSLPIIAPVHSDVEIEAAIIAVGREQGGGLVVMPDAWMALHRAPIILAAARNNVPAVYYRHRRRLTQLRTPHGSPISPRRLLRRSYSTRREAGRSPGAVPGIEMVVNLKTAKALGLTIPETLLATANEVIEWESRNAKRLDH